MNQVEARSFYLHSESCNEKEPVPCFCSLKCALGLGCNITFLGQGSFRDALERPVVLTCWNELLLLIPKKAWNNLLLTGMEGTAHVSGTSFLTPLAHGNCQFVVHMKFVILHG